MECVPGHQELFIFWRALDANKEARAYSKSNRLERPKAKKAKRVKKEGYPLYPIVAVSFTENRWKQWTKFHQKSLDFQVNSLRLISQKSA